jgi:hypothetical protein
MADGPSGVLWDQLNFAGKRARSRASEETQTPKRVGYDAAKPIATLRPSRSTFGSIPSGPEWARLGRPAAVTMKPS